MTLMEGRDIRRREPANDTAEYGFAMIATLIVVVILAILVALTLSLSGGNTPKSSGNATLRTTTTIPKSIAAGAQQATVAACEANFETVRTALATYRALNGVNPPAGTAWATSAANGGPLLTAWPSNAKSYAITWNGLTLDVVPAKGVASHGSFGTASPLTGCLAA